MRFEPPQYSMSKAWSHRWYTVSLSPVHPPLPVRCTAPPRKYGWQALKYRDEGLSSSEVSISVSPSVGDEAAELRPSIATEIWAASLAGEGSFLFFPFAVFVARVPSCLPPAPTAPDGAFLTVDLGTEAPDSTLGLFNCPATASFCSPRAGHDCIP